MAAEVIDATSSLKWLFFNVILSLLPLALNAILVVVGRVTTSWPEMLKDGELFFFSTAISASSIGGLLFQVPSNKVIAAIVTYLLMIILMLSTGMFALSSFMKLKQIDAIDKRVFGASSAWRAIYTIILSYIAFALGGSIWFLLLLTQPIKSGLRQKELFAMRQLHPQQQLAQLLK